MQKFYTPKPYKQNIQKIPLKENALPHVPGPSLQASKNLMAYAMALEVISTQALGKLYLLRN
jgi:hypothetical protein